MLVGIKSDHHVITDQVPVIFSSPVRGTYDNYTLGAMYMHIFQIILPNMHKG